MNSERKDFKPAVHWDVTVQPYFEAAFGAFGLDKLSEALSRPPLINGFRLNLNKTTREVCTPFCIRAASLLQICTDQCDKLLHTLADRVEPVKRSYRQQRAHTC